MKKPAWIDEFVAFAVKGNAMALAVGTIIGAAFSTITKSLTDDVIMPIVAIFMGGIDFSELKITLPRLFGEAPMDEAGNAIANTLNYGNFISAIINFLILALASEKSGDNGDQKENGSQSSHTSSSISKTGKVRVKVVPVGGTTELVTVMVPRLRSTMSRTMDSPSPLPPV